MAKDFYIVESIAHRCDLAPTKSTKSKKTKPSCRKKGCCYLIHWKDYTEKHDTWETTNEFLRDCGEEVRQMINDFNATQPVKATLAAMVISPDITCPSLNTSTDTKRSSDDGDVEAKVAAALESDGRQGITGGALNDNSTKVSDHDQHQNAAVKGTSQRQKLSSNQGNRKRQKTYKRKQDEKKSIKHNDGDEDEDEDETSKNGDAYSTSSNDDSKKVADNDSIEKVTTAAVPETPKAEISQSEDKNDDDLRTLEDKEEIPISQTTVPQPSKATITPRKRRSTIKRKGTGGYYVSKFNKRLGICMKRRRVAKEK